MCAQQKCEPPPEARSQTAARTYTYQSSQSNAARVYTDRAHGRPRGGGLITQPLLTFFLRIMALSSLYLASLQSAGTHSSCLLLLGISKCHMQCKSVHGLHHIQSLETNWLSEHNFFSTSFLMIIHIIYRVYCIISLLRDASLKTFSSSIRLVVDMSFGVFLSQHHSNKSKNSGDKR